MVFRYFARGALANTPTMGETRLDVTDATDD